MNGRRLKRNLKSDKTLIFVSGNNCFATMEIGRININKPYCRGLFSWTLLPLIMWINEVNNKQIKLEIIIIKEVNFMVSGIGPCDFKYCSMSSIDSSVVALGSHCDSKNVIPKYIMTNPHKN